MQRPDAFVLARFLERVHERPGLSRSALQRAVGVNYDVLRRYLEFMDARGWVIEDEGIWLNPSGHAMRERTHAWLLELLGDTVL